MTTKTEERSGAAAEPLGRLKDETRNLAGALGDRALASIKDRVEGITGRLLDYAGSGGGSSLTAALTGASELAEGKSPGRAAAGAGVAAVKNSFAGLLGRGGGGKGRNLKVTNIVESIDVAAPIRLAYDQWTQFADFPSFMKKVESVEQEGEEKLNWKAQVFWSHRTWQAMIEQQVPDKRIVWTSKGQKGHVDGAVTFHELAPELTRILVVLEYHPQGMFEHTGNLWRAQGRRVRLELKHFRRHVMTQAILHPDEIQGWRGVIENGEVVKDHQTALKEEEQADRDDYAADDAGEDDYVEPEAGAESEDDYATEDEDHYATEDEGDYAADDDYVEDALDEDGRDAEPVRARGGAT